MEYASSEEMFELVHGRRTDDPDWFVFNGVVVAPADVVSILASHLSDTRMSKIEAALAERTDNLTVVMEGMVDLGNVSAVMRTADGLGIHSVHAIDTADVYKRSRRTTRGADKWLDRYRWPDVESCFDHLRSRGYRILVADLVEDAADVREVDLTRRTALVFGNELEGISREARDLAHGAVTVPMSGFADSLNISVAASILLYEGRRQRQHRYGSSGDLSETDSARIRAVWYLKSVRESHLLVARGLAEGHDPGGAV